MGAWEHDIMDNDTAMDVSYKLDFYLEKGLSLKKAFTKTKKNVLKSTNNTWDILALAHLQIEKMGEIDKNILKAANKIIEFELSVVGGWTSPKKREKALLKFKKLINLPADKLLSKFIMEKCAN